VSAPVPPGGTTRVEIIDGATRTALTLGTPGPRGPSYPAQLFDADLIDAPTLDATNDFLRAPAASATDAANAAAALAEEKAGLADQKAQAAQGVVDAGANILAANTQTTLNAGIVQSLVSQPDYSQKGTVRGILLNGDLPTGAAEVGVDGAGRLLSARASNGRTLFATTDPTNRETVTRTLLPGDFSLPGATLYTDGAGRLVQAVSVGGQSLFTTIRHCATAQLLPGDLPTGADPVLGVDGAGRQISLTAPSAKLDTPTVLLLPGDGASGGFADPSGRPMPGVVDPTSGLIANRKSAFPSIIPYIAGATPTRQLRAKLSGGVDILISVAGSDPDVFWMSGDSIIYQRNALAWANSSGSNSGVADINDTAHRFEGESLASEVTTATAAAVRGVFVYGQSNSCGYGPSSAVYSTFPVRPGRALTFGIGPRMMPEDVPNGSPLPMEYTASWRDLREFSEVRSTYARQSIVKPGETPCSGIGFQLTQPGALAATDVVVTATMGVGSQSIAALSKGSHAYANLIRAVHSAKVKADRLGLPFDVPDIVWIQGETDANTAPATYTTAMLALQSNLDADIKATTGQSGNVLLVCAQTASWTSANLTRTDVPTVCLTLALQYPDRFVCTGAMYQYPFPTGLHLSNYGQRMHGEQIGRAIARKAAGTTQPMLYCAIASLSGSTVTATMAGGEGNLVLDTSFVSDPGNYGIAFLQDSGNTVTISSITVSGSNTVTITLSAPPTGANQRIEFARTGISGANGGPTTGPRCCLRDTVGALRSDGTPMHKYACIQTVLLS
jgi:hypothetical protein